MYSELPQASLTMMPEEAIERTRDMMDATFHIRKKNLCYLIVSIITSTLYKPPLGASTDLECHSRLSRNDPNQHIKPSSAARNLYVVRAGKK